MIAIIAVCAVLLPNPPDLQPVERVTNAPQAVEMPAYQVEQIIWYQYYGEWAQGGNGAEAEANAAKPDATTGNEAFRKSSTK
jgi:hypothetical protein